LSVRKNLLILCVISTLLALTLALVLVGSDFTDRGGRNAALAQSSEMTDYYRNMVHYHLWSDESIPDESILLIGDSITQSLVPSLVHCNAVNFGIGGDTTVGVLERIPKYHSLSRAGAVVIAVGVNDIARRSDEQIVENYNRILSAIPKGPSVFISLILPVDERSLRESRSLNDRINRINSGLRKLAVQHSAFLVDATKDLKDSTGSLNPAFHVGDGVHLSKAGYDVWVNALKQSLKQAPH
jgi:lysophospholipase L1-like esterase